MKSIDFVTALARLLSDTSLVSAFAQDPQQVADALQIADGDRDRFVALSATQVSTQSRLLVKKRMKEVYKLLPQTFRLAGTDAATYFSNYAETVWPQSHRRHLEDAYQFCKFLKAHHYPVAQCEYHRVKFLYSGRRFSLGLSRDVIVNGRTLPALQLFYRYKATIGQWQFYLKA